ncbi:MAG: cob(I)yrinic acid a,c-diamide adenosyltransferase [Bacteroidales bacterium]|nr:cob(I)yrinic acid a,c-diamide adenosyltransferase [Bacteroidales bacterium]
MKIYTRTGDNSITSLPGGKRVPKHHVRVEAYGAVDELIAWMGLLRDCIENRNTRKSLIYIQEQLMKCACALAIRFPGEKQKKLLPDKDIVVFLEKEIDKIEASLPPLDKLILPGGNILVSYCHIARCVCRRTERTVSRLNETEKIPEIISGFLNRLSDYLFVLSRKISLELDIEEVKWLI